MDRRTFLGGTAAAGVTVTALTALTATACDTGSTSGAGGSKGGGTATATASSSGRTATPPTSADWKALGDSLDGTLVLPDDTDWQTASQLYNTRFDDLAPDAVAYVAHPEDIGTVLSYARAHGVRPAIRNGGHSYAGWSSGDGRLIVDVSKLDAVRASGGAAVVGAGAKLIDVYRTLAAKGVTVPAGSCPTVGISGLTLGGGHGVVSRAYGLTCDSLTGASIVTADGRQLTADADENPDLFWALRGAGNGNFGVVTELRFRTHTAPQAVTGYLTWPWAQAAEVFLAWQEWGPDQPDEIWSSLHLDRKAGGAPTVSVSAFSLGGYGELQNAVDRLADRAGGPASGVSLNRHGYEESMEAYAGCSSYAGAECRLPGSTPGRSAEGELLRETYAAASDFYDRSLSEAGVRTLLAQLDKLGEVADGDGSIAFTALGGAVNRVDPTATAFVHRRSRMLAQYLVSWPSGGSEGHIPRNWLSAAHEAMRPYASGAAYQNYADPELKNWRSAYYGDAAARLAKVKKRYDPERLFSYAQGV
ncbi:FAD-binding oxidoreductase [Streptomyces sp. CRN 30]|uniref:FAD-binding oxidoreductase n=1 Tax=Streptomyces sp. CRN 30 TaxID=3075613 RepID=UPI002A80BB19|nr:FAD-binding oxidoreductase [Streptomyces sp. CRN 30]